MSTSTFFHSKSVDHEIVPWITIKEACGIFIKNNTIEIFMHDDTYKNILEYNSQEEAIENINRLREECETLPKMDELEQRIEKLEERLESFIKEGVEKIDAMWYSPNMPGFEMAKIRFGKRVIGKNKKRRAFKRILGSAIRHGHV